MSKSWYPIINTEKCIECAACINYCKNNVYDQETKPKPIVKSPDNCYEGCHGCGNTCPVDAISYYGDKLITNIAQNTKTNNNQ